MSTKVSRPRKQRQKDDMKQEIVAQVHKSGKRESGSETEIIKKIEQTEEGSESNKTFIIEDKNDNYNSLRTPSRDVSVDEESQINSKILNLIETEMRRDINKHSHFSDSRPQSLSFYEDEKVPEELSGNLELLSPEERKHYKRRKEYGDIDIERNAYNNMQDVISRENDEIILNGSIKKSKSRKKRHCGDPELGLGDSREMMIPKEKRKSKKKKREYSPLSSSSSKKKHRKRDDDYEPKTDITLALEELQDDVFENGPEEFARPERVKKSPRQSDKLYVQRKNKFDVVSRGDLNSSKLNMPGEDNSQKRFSDYHPIELAVIVQKCFFSFSFLCHGFLGGLGLAHYFYLRSNNWLTDPSYIKHYANFSDLYTCIFYFLGVICLISVFDKHDISHMNYAHLRDLARYRKSSFAIIIYAVCLLVHLVAARTDDKLGLLAFNDKTNSTIEFPDSELQHWGNLSFWRALLAALGWVFVAFSARDDMFYVHLKNMKKYIVSNA